MGFWSRTSRNDGLDLLVLGPRLVFGCAQKCVLGSVDARRRLLGHGQRLGVTAAEAGQDAQEGGGDLGVELRAGAGLELGPRLGVGEGLPVGPAERHGVVRVHDAHGAGDLGDRVPGKVVRVAVAAEALVVVAHARHELLGEERPDDVGAEDRVLAHEVPLAVAERGGLEQDAVRDGDLADVVQVGGLLHLLLEAWRPAELSAEQHHVGGYPGGMAEGVVVLGVQGRAQRLEVAEVHALDVFVQARVVQRQRELRADPFQQAAVDRVVGCRL